MEQRATLRAALAEVSLASAARMAAAALDAHVFQIRLASPDGLVGRDIGLGCSSARSS